MTIDTAGYNRKVMTILCFNLFHICLDAVEKSCLTKVDLFSLLMDIHGGTVPFEKSDKHKS